MRIRSCHFPAWKSPWLLHFSWDKESALTMAYKNLHTLLKFYTPFSPHSFPFYMLQLMVFSVS